MAVIEEYVSERGCKVRIHDDFIKTDPKDIQKILDNIARIAAQPSKNTKADK